MKNILKTLTELQDVDTQLAEIEAHKGNLPQQVQNLEAAGAEVQGRLEAAQAKVEADKKELKTLGSSKDEYKTKLAKYQDQLYLVTTNREYDALTNEIENVKSHIQEIVDQQGILTDEVEQLEEEIDALTNRQTELKENLATSRKELTSKTDLTNARQKELETQREELADKLSKRYLRKYERILQVRGQAVVPVKRRACGGCHKQISDQLLFEIKQGNRFIECEGCGRILVYPDSEDDK
ncbi:MAG: hypothetical protein K9N11_09385 [Lentisphaeria bacterium]|nr:hypothetical protein [Candidatus Neomarinimicrobiota bacterium]MCF7843049.1 hypothetical protein [Lentisphaeria bacterium]